MMDEHKNLVRRVVTELINEKNLDAVSELFDEDCRIHDPTIPIEFAGHDGVRQYLQLFFDVFPDLHMEIEEIFGEGEMVAYRWIAKGTHSGLLMGIEPTHKKIVLSGQAQYQFEAGKIKNDWVSADSLGLLHQLGVLKG